MEEIFPRVCRNRVELTDLSSIFNDKISNKIKIYILFALKNIPTGGGNQFLRCLKNYFAKKDCYAEDINMADVVLFNSYQYIKDVSKLKCKYPDHIFVHRIDGPIRLYNRLNDRRDFVTYTAMEKIADGTVFQSDWSKRKNIEFGVPTTKFSTTIINAPDPSIFNRSGRKPWESSSKARLIATSWSANWKKGFDVYQWLDEHLDFSRYEMVFVGNTPITFKNIKHISPLPSHELANELKKSDIFITASKSDPCSNSLIEALHCGLPAIARNDGGHPEIIKSAGELFAQPEDIPGLIEKIAQNYEEYQKRIELPSIDEVGQAYYDFMYSIYKAARKGDYVPKKLTKVAYFQVKGSLWLWKGHNRWLSFCNRLTGKGR